MKKQIATALLVTLPTALPAAEPIESAFGMTLGQTFTKDHQSFAGMDYTTAGERMYRFKPENKFRSCSDDHALTTPKTSKVYMIWATGYVGREEAKCEAEKKVIMSILEKKYGASRDSDTIEQDHRWIAVRCKRKYKNGARYDMDIRYVDAEISMAGEKERVEIEAAKINTEGL